MQTEDLHVYLPTVVDIKLFEHEVQDIVVVPLTVHVSTRR